jgi:hypothetical protein
MTSTFEFETYARSSKSDRFAFYHKAILKRNGESIEQALIHYINRTWESYTFQSVILYCIEKAYKHKAITKQEYEELKKRYE